MSWIFWAILIAVGVILLVSMLGWAALMVASDVDDRMGDD